VIIMKKDSHTVVVIFNYRTAQNAIENLNKKGFDTAKCCSCGEAIVNRMVDRHPHNSFERLLEKWFKMKFKIWDCNLGQPIWKKKQVVCDTINCELNGVHKKLED